MQLQHGFKCSSTTQQETEPELLFGKKNTQSSTLLKVSKTLIPTYNSQQSLKATTMTLEWGDFDRLYLEAMGCFAVLDATLFFD